MGELTFIALGIAIGFAVRHLYAQYDDTTAVLLDDARAELQETRDDLINDLIRVEQQRDTWKRIATRLVGGAEEQIDALRGTTPPTNEAWLTAWHRYHKEIQNG